MVLEMILLHFFVGAGDTIRHTQPLSLLPATITKSDDVLIVVQDKVRDLIIDIPEQPTTEYSRGSIPIPKWYGMDQAIKWKREQQELQRRGY